MGSDSKTSQGDVFVYTRNFFPSTVDEGSYYINVQL